jgi:hypothetical protein
MPTSHGVRSIASSAAIGSEPVVSSTSSFAVCRIWRPAGARAVAPASAVAIYLAEELIHGVRRQLIGHCSATGDEPIRIVPGSDAEGVLNLTWRD